MCTSTTMGDFFLPPRDRDRRRKSFSNAYIAANIAHRTRLMLQKKTLERQITKLWDQYDEIRHELDHLTASVKVRDGVAYVRDGDSFRTVGDIHRVADLHKLVRRQGEPQLWGCRINEYWVNGGAGHRWQGGKIIYGTGWWVSRKQAEAMAWQWIIEGTHPPEETIAEEHARHKAKLLRTAS